MSKPKNSGLISAKERTAFAWLWRGYLRQRLPLLLLVTALVTLQSLAMVGFLHTLRTSMASFFSSNNGVYVAAPDIPDANGDGIYEVELQLDGADLALPLSITSGQNSAVGDLAANATAFDPVALLAAQGVEVGQRDVFIQGLDAGAFTFVPSQNGQTLAWLVSILAVLIVARAICSYSAGRLAAWVSTRAALALRTDLLSRLLSLDLTYFDHAPPGRLVHRVFTMVTQLEAFFSRNLVVNANYLLTLVFILVYLATVHLGLFLFIGIAMPLALAGIQMATKRIRHYATRSHTAMADFLGAVENTLAGIRTIKLTNQGPRARERLTGYSREMADLQYGIARNQAIVPPFVDLLAAMFLVFVLGLGGLAVMNGWAGLTATTLITFAIGLGLIFDPARMLARFNATLSQLFVTLVEIHEMDGERPQIVDAEGAATSFDSSADITFDSVEYAYETDGHTGAESQPLFKGLSFTFEGGKTSAIVGPTGAGKSTIFSLIARLYEPKAGQIRIGDQDIRTLNSTVLRQAFGVVSQDIFVFDGTIEDNIRFVRPDADQAAVLAAAQKAELRDLIEEKGVQTVGPRGAQLSGGQKQRIAIARAFLQDAPIILLDEATSALDQQTEAKITAALKTLCQGRTTLIIAHRLSTITHADKIIVLDSGKVAEEGTHSVLKTKRGLYAALYEAQASGMDTRSGRRWWRRT